MREIAEQKMRDLNAADIEGAMRIVAGTARSMGILIGIPLPETDISEGLEDAEER